MVKEFVKNLKDISFYKAPKGIAYRKMAVGSSIHPIEVDYVPVQKGKSIPGHIHEKSNAFVFILQGSGTVTLGTKTIPVTKDDIINIPCGTWHEFHASSLEDLVFLSIQNPPIGRDYLFRKD